MDTLFTKAEIHRLLPAPRTLDGERAKGIFLAALRARDAVVELGQLLARAMAPLAAWSARRQSMAELNGLNDRDLQDIGLTRGEIDHVASGVGAQAGAQARSKAPKIRLQVYAPHRLHAH
jgi:uncharacterized protein YjiS (DUF1127 family)